MVASMASQCECGDAVLLLRKVGQLDRDVPVRSAWTRKKDRCWSLLPAVGAPLTKSTTIAAQQEG